MAIRRIFVDSKNDRLVFSPEAQDFIPGRECKIGISIL